MFTLHGYELYRFPELEACHKAGPTGSLSAATDARSAQRLLYRFEHMNIPTDLTDSPPVQPPMLTSRQ
jgi:hypothetical protein